jgi:hypothetical protein
MKKLPAHVEEISLLARGVKRGRPPGREKKLELAIQCYAALFAQGQKKAKCLARLKECVKLLS